MKSHSIAMPLMLAALLALSGCGPRAGGQSGSTLTAPREPAIERLRRAAAQRPDDPAVQRARVEWELLADGGDPDAAEQTLARAVELTPHDVALAYLQGLLAEQRGRPDDAVDAFVRVLREAPTSSDPLATAYVQSAVVYLSDVEVDAMRFDERVLPEMRALFDQPGRVGLPARLRLFFWLRNVALRHGDLARADALEQQLGCPTRVRVAGPFGLFGLAAFDRHLPAEQPGPLADRYDLGDGRGTAATRTVEARRCSFGLGSRERATAGAGTRVVEATLHASAAGRYVLALDSDASFRVTVDGRTVGEVDRRRRELPSVAFVALELTAGDHELELKVTSRTGAPTVTWVLDRATETYDPMAGVALPEAPEGPLPRYLTIETLMLRGQPLAAREQVLHALGHDPSAALLILVARVAGADPFAPATQRADDERTILTRAAARDPRAYAPVKRLAMLEPNDTDRLAALRRVAAAFPRLLSLELALGNELDEAGFPADAQRSLERAQALRPDACVVTGARFDALNGRGRMHDARALLPALLACNVNDQSALDLALARRDWAGAEAELARLSPFLTPTARRGLALVLARARGDAATEQRLVAEAEAEADEGTLVVLQADRRYAAGDARAALDALEREAARAPSEAHDLRRITFALSGRDVMEPYRVDGLEVLRRFQESGRNYDGYAAVLVFDYSVTRILESGSAIDLVHQIFRVQTQQGVEQFAELNLRGRVLRVRVIRPDGTFREPDEIAATTTMPPLEIGDFVEYEYVREVGPIYGDAYESGGWIFQNFSQPFDHSEMVFVAPPSLDVKFDVRGAVPPPTVRERDGLREHRFLMTQSRPLVREPNAVEQPAILPSLRAGVRVTWPRVLGGIQDALLDLDPEDPSVHRLLEGEIAAGPDVPAPVRAQRIHRWVLENIESADDSFYRPAPAMLAARAGHRARVLRYLLENAGVPAKLALARTLAGEPPSDDVPDSSAYSQVIVVADVGRPLWMSTGMRGVPHDQLSPLLRGQPAVLLDDALTRVTVPTSAGGPSRQQIEAEVVIGRDGVAQVDVSITWTGTLAGELREALERIPPGERSRAMAERLVPSLLPGGEARPEDVTFQGFDDWEQPLVLRIRAQSAGLFARAADGFRMLPLFGSQAEEGFARLPSRTTTELVGEIDHEFQLVLRAPGVLRGPQPRTFTGPSGAEASVRVERGREGALRVTRRVHIPTALVPASSYPTFAQFCRAVTQLEQDTVTISAR